MGNDHFRDFGRRRKIPVAKVRYYFIEETTGRHHIPEQGKDFPYSFMIPYTDEASNKVIFCYLLVEETEDGYSAVVERMEEFERKLKE